jgi:TetR/AcrR family transcriptional regulator, mexJK operon transcriptional repressor
MDDPSAAARVNADSGRGEESPSRRPGRPTLTNEQLLDKALEIFLEQGFDRTSVDAITAAAGIAKRTVYQRYGDKKNLFKEALKRAIESWILPIETLRAAETDDFEETLLALGRILVANIMTPAGIQLLRITNAESARLPEIGAYTYELGTERTIDYLADLFRRYVDPDGKLDHDWREAAIAYLYLVVTGPPTMTAWGMTIDEDIIDQHTRYGVRLFLHGLLGTIGAATARQSPVLRASVAGEASLAAGQDDELRNQNRRLKALLVDAMLEVATLREATASR